jgi:NAD(P)-dependent dehydrogenase (short-subunit alcohol dehydrogenase family)
MSFTGEVVFVTGAASGMGRLAAQNMARAGARVAALDVNEEGLRATAEGYDRVACYALDVADARGVEERVREVERDLGPIDRVYNAAAIMPTEILLKQDIDTVKRIMDINYGGVAAVCHAIMPGMLARGRGDMIIFASIAGWLPTMHFGAYNASKFAVVAYTEVVYHETRGRGVRVVCVCPPPVDTPLLEQAKSKPKVLDQMPPIQPQDVLDAIEGGLEKGQLFVFPGRGTKAAWRLRRFLPGLMWRNVHRVEGAS